MSVQQELVSLEQAREDLKKKLADISSTLDSLYAKRNLLEQKLEPLKTRHSSLAKKLLEQTQMELDALNQEIAPVQEKQAKLEKDLEGNQKNISERANDTSLYIQEQSNLMVSTFLEYLGNNLEAIGLETKKTYTVMEVADFQNDRYGGCYSPTGSIGIYDESAKSFIVSSSDFYFKNTLCTFDRGIYDNLICHYSNWYIEYRNRFISVLLETLEKNYTYGEFFKLTIEDSRFTLELV